MHFQTQRSIIGGDMNAQKGNDGNSKFYLHNLPSKKGEYLADILLENKIACLNTK